MKKRLHIVALIASPIIALNSASPFFIFEKVSLTNFLLLLIPLTVNIYLSWLIHIFFVFRYPHQNIAKRFILTYLINIVLRLPFLISDYFNLNPLIIGVKEYLAYPIIVSFALNAIVMIICNAIVAGYKRAAAEKEIEALKFQNSEAQKQMLIQQLQPHFLFNALSILKSLIKDNPDDAEDYTIKLSEFLRYSVEAHKHETIRLDKELQFVKDYIALQHVRFDDAFHFTINIPDDALEKKVPVFALQTLVENIFKHNFFTKKNPMNFSIYYEHNSLIVQNKRVSLKLTEHTATGLANLNKRYELITGKGISVATTETDFSVTLSLIEP
jgi:two-component system, LytTR family, sensor kinase